MMDDANAFSANAGDAFVLGLRKKKGQTSAGPAQNRRVRFDEGR